MPLYQNSVLNKYLKQQNSDVVAKAFKKFSKYFHDPKIQENIRSSKEEEYQGIFLTELFSKILGYTMKPNANFNLVAEYKNEKNSRKADGAILKDNEALGVIELKGTNTKDLEKVRQQAFDYKANQTGCVYVITSNFEKVRFYINNAVEFEEFDLFTINQERFELFYLCLAKDNLLGNVPLKIKEASVQEEETITKKFYKDYSTFKRELFRDLVKLNMKNYVFRTELNNEDADRANKNIKHNLFKKSQKLIDRFLFVFFAEDRGLLPPNSALKILEQWNKLKDLDAYTPLYQRYQLYFTYLDQGRKGTDKSAEIFAYNGGLFKPDPVLDSLKISDELLAKHTAALQAYDFESQVDVNILGHIFENSLNEIENVNAEIEGTDFDKQKTKRKKDGVFYTPKYITKYIVDNTVGKLCYEKKVELNIIEEEYHSKRQKETKKKLLAALETYREWLLQLTILDPACGSGAFLNQALDYLIKEHGYIDELQTNLLGGGLVFPNIENTVLENNIFGVDLNEESVEIAKLSLWLRTAQPRRKLNDLSSNIKCGNSLIDSKAIAGDKAFKWDEEFPNIFKEKEKKAYHITTATHDSRTSKRMVDYKVRELRDNGMRPKPEGIWLEKEDEILIAETIAQIVKEDQLNVLAINICGDHMHILLVCEEEEITKIVGKIKAISSKEYNTAKGITTRGHVPLSKEEKKTYNSLWTQKFGSKKIEDEKQLFNTIEYIQTNREKHQLPSSKKLQGIINKVCCSYEHAFRMEKAGGFDVVIGNPPYGAKIGELDKDYLKNEYEFINPKTSDTYIYFTFKMIKLLKEKGVLGEIIPNTWMLINSGVEVREELLKYEISEIIDYGDGVFDDVTVESMTIIINNSLKNSPVCVKRVVKQEVVKQSIIDKNNWTRDSSFRILLDLNKEVVSLIDKLNSVSVNFSQVSEIIWGIKPYQVGHGVPAQTREMLKERVYHSDIKINDEWKPLLVGSNINRYKIDCNNIQYIKYGKNLMYPSNGEKIISPKLLMRQTSDIIRAVYDNNSFYPQNSIFIISSNKVNIKKILLVLNSKLVNFFYKINNPQTGKTFAEIKPSIIKQIPIHKNIESLAETKVDEILDLNEKVIEISNHFKKYLSSQFSIEKPPKKLQNWHELEFGEFIKELNKAIKKVGGEKLTKMDEMEWMEVFETKKAEAQNLKAEIDRTDKEIDNMVYELYGLSEEEIEIVEQA